MAFKFFAAFALVAVASAGYIPAPQAYYGIQHHSASHPVIVTAPEPYDPHPHYHFSYSVHDSHTGDVKSQAESRDGDAVHGEYSLIDSDGYKRIVKYTADDKHGFNAVVHREPLGHAVVPVVKAAPAIYHSAPVAYAAAPAHSYFHH